MPPRKKIDLSDIEPIGGTLPEELQHSEPSVSPELPNEPSNATESRIIHGINKHMKNILLGIFLMALLGIGSYVFFFQVDEDEIEEKVSQQNISETEDIQQRQESAFALLEEDTPSLPAPSGEPTPQPTPIEGNATSTEGDDVNAVLGKLLESLEEQEEIVNTGSAPTSGIQAPSEPAPASETVAPVPTTQQPVPEIGMILVQTPQAEFHATSPLVIEGKAKVQTPVFFRISSMDGIQLILESAHLSRPADADGFRPFRMSLAYDFSSTKEGYVEVFTKDALGSEQNLIRHHVFFE